jgi:predicted nucleic acid-binding protein
MCLGVAILPVGQRQSSLLVAIDDMFNQDFAGRILAFDSSVVRAYVQIVTQRKQIGRPISQFDAQIAAIAKAHDAILATRNIKDFENCGIELVNPWL